MKVAAYQVPLLMEGSTCALDLIREQVAWCEAENVSVLCCPEAILGGLADYSDNPSAFAVRIDNGQLASVLTPLASTRVTCIVGFTELACDGTLYNAAAVFHRGQVEGVYRKVHPAIRRSVYAPGREVPVFHACQLTFGVLLCNDSNDPDLARCMAAQGAEVIFIPTNNGLPNQRAPLELNAAARTVDAALATENRIWVIRADVAGRNGTLTSLGSSEIVDPDGDVVQEARLEEWDLLVAEINLAKGM